MSNVSRRSARLAGRAATRRDSERRWRSAAGPLFATIRRHVIVSGVIAASCLVAVGRAAYLWHGAGQWLGAAYIYDSSGPRLEPDTTSYLSGFGLFPSPLGTLLGEGGLGTLAAVNLVSAGGLVLVAAALVGWRGPRAAVAAVAAVLLPVSSWAVYATTDTVAALLVAAAILAYRSGLTRRAVLLALVACGLHLAVVPVVLLLAVGSRSRRLVAVAAAVVVAAVAAGLLTQYRAAFTVPDVGDLITAVTGVGLALAPALVGLFVAWDGALLLGTAGAVLGSTMIAAVGDNADSRYALPLLPLAAATFARAVTSPVVLRTLARPVLR